MWGRRSVQSTHWRTKERRKPVHFNPKLREVLFAASVQLIVALAARPNRAFFQRPHELDRDKNALSECR
jgi:hypothetical protein